MIIGVDLRALQTGHKYRGIGEVAKQTTDRILYLAQKDIGNDVSFIFYEYDDDDPKTLLTLPEGIKYDVVKVGSMPEGNHSVGASQKIKRNFSQLYGNPVPCGKRCDVFLQFDYMFGVPKGTRTVLIKHDLIPYIFWNKYFESAWVPFKNKAARTTVKTLFNNYKFLRVLKRSLKRSHVILTVSHSTKQDLKRLFRIKDEKIRVSHLGASLKPAKTSGNRRTSIMPDKPFLLFVGAGDARRKVEDLIAAFNNLKAEGHDIQLVLVGENFKSPQEIPNMTVRNAVLGSSYSYDIKTLGYIDDHVKHSLFQRAIAFVYPTRYEGFGIPVLESMLLNCPVITYKNSSIPEVGGDYVCYANDWMDIRDQVNVLLVESQEKRKARVDAAKRHAEKFTWDETAKVIYSELINASDNKGRKT